MVLYLPWPVPSGSSGKAERSDHWLPLKPCDPLLLVSRRPRGPKYYRSILDTGEHIRSTAITCYLRLGKTFSHLFNLKVQWAIFHS